MNKIEMPPSIKYRIKQVDSVFYPQYKKGRKWLNCTYPYYDSRSGDTTMCNKQFSKIEDAEKFIEDLIKKETITIFYKDNWK